MLAIDNTFILQENNLEVQFLMSYLILFCFHID